MSIESIAVSSFMTRNVITQTEDQNIQAVSRTMYENNIGSVIIVKNKERDSDIINNRPILSITGNLLISFCSINATTSFTKASGLIVISGLLITSETDISPKNFRKSYHSCNVSFGNQSYRQAFFVVFS